MSADDKARGESDETYALSRCIAFSAGHDFFQVIAAIVEEHEIRPGALWLPSAALRSEIVDGLDQAFEKIDRSAFRARHLISIAMDFEDHGCGYSHRGHCLQLEQYVCHCGGDHK